MRISDWSSDVCSSDLTITIKVSADRIANEGNERFHVDLTGATNATVGRGHGVGTIKDNDALTVSVNDFKIHENPADGPNSGSFTLTLSQPSATAVEVPWTITLPGAPGAGADDLVGTVVLTGTATIPAGSTTVEIGPFTAADDAVFEPDETFTVEDRKGTRQNSSH